MHLAVAASAPRFTRTPHPPHPWHACPLGPPQVVITDKDVVLPLIRDNIELNDIPDVPGSGKCCGGRCVPRELGSG
jgi:hypothetical protein